MIRVRLAQWSVTGWTCRRCWASLAVGLLASLLLLCLAPRAASAASFLQGEDLPICPANQEKFHPFVLAGDGNTAVWGTCVYARVGETWEPQGTLPVKGGEKAYPDPEAISTDGNTVLISYWEPELFTVFSRVAGMWVEQATLDPSDALALERGSALSGDGNTAVIDGWNQAKEQTIWIFDRSGETWSEAAKFSGAESFGEALALSGDGGTLLVGEPDVRIKNDRGGYGVVYVFIRSGETWTQQAVLMGSGEKVHLEGGHFTFGGGFGGQLALSEDGNTALIAASWDSARKGAVWAFRRAGDTWEQQGPKFSPTHAKAWAEFGDSLALTADGSTGLIGAEAPGERGHRRGELGHAFVFTSSGETWTETEMLTPRANEKQDRFGGMLRLSGNGESALISEGDWTHLSMWTR